MNKGIIIGGIIILAGAASTPYFCGNAIESDFDRKVNEFQVAFQQTDPTIKLEKTEYSKGWFSSTAKTLLTVDDLTIPVEHKITHGPFGYFGLGKVESSFVFNDQQKQVVDSLFDGKQPLLITTNVAFSGSKSVDVYSAEINKKTLPNDPSTTINWAGMKGSFKVTGDRMVTDVKAPKLTITSRRETFDMQNLTLTGDGGYSDDFDKMANISLDGVATLNIDKLSVTTRQGTFSSKLAMNATTTDDKTNVGYSTTLKFTNIEVPQNLGFTASVDLVEFGLGFNGIPKKPLIDFLKKLSDIQQQGRTPTDMEMMTMGQGFAVSLLQGTPSIDGHALMTSKQGDVNISAVAKLATPDTATDLATLAMGSMNRIEITITPSFSESLLDEAINQGQLPMDKDEFITGITEKNRFILNNGKFSGKFEFKKGQFYSNGQPDPELQNNLRYMLPRGIF